MKMSPARKTTGYGKKLVRERYDSASHRTAMQQDNYVSFIDTLTGIALTAARAALLAT
jgi:hypothetical protein